MHCWNGTRPCGEIASRTQMRDRQDDEMHIAILYVKEHWLSRNQVSVRL